MNLLLKELGNKGNLTLFGMQQIEDATVNVTIKVDDDSVKLIRKGDINMNLHFVEGQTTTTFSTIYRLDEFH